VTFLANQIEFKRFGYTNETYVQLILVGVGLRWRMVMQPNNQFLFTQTPFLIQTKTSQNQPTRISKHHHNVAADSRN